MTRYSGFDCTRKVGLWLEEMQLDKKYDMDVYCLKGVLSIMNSDALHTVQFWGSRFQCLSETESSVFVSSSTTAVTFRPTFTGSGVGCTSTATRNSEGSSAVYNEGQLRWEHFNWSSTMYQVSRGHSTENMV